MMILLPGIFVDVSSQKQRFKYIGTCLIENIECDKTNSDAPYYVAFRDWNSIIIVIFEIVLQESFNVYHFILTTFHFALERLHVWISVKACLVQRTEVRLWIILFKYFVSASDTFGKETS